MSPGEGTGVGAGAGGGLVVAVGGGHEHRQGSTTAADGEGNGLDGNRRKEGKFFFFKKNRSELLDYIQWFRFKAIQSLYKYMCVCVYVCGLYFDKNVVLNLKFVYYFSRDLSTNNYILIEDFNLLPV